MHRYICVPELYSKGGAKFIEETDLLINTAITKLLLTGGSAVLCIPILNVAELKQPYVTYSNVMQTSMGILNFAYHEKHKQVIVRKMGDSNNG